VVSAIVTATETMGSALLTLARQDVTPPPCAGSDGWTSEDRDERALAARCCAGCPLFDPCRVLADELKVTFGVWAGVDRGPRPYSRARST
jgi:hypothetical protein